MEETFAGQNAVKEIHKGKLAIDVAECCETVVVDGVEYTKGEEPKKKESKKPAKKD